MGCNTSKHAAANNTAIDPRYDAQGNLVITHSTSSLKLKKSGSSFSQDVEGNLDVMTIPVDDLLRGSHKSFHKTKPERLFLLLAKALHQQEHERGGGEAGPIDPDVFDDLITERQALYVAVIDQIQRQEKDALNHTTTSSTTNTSSSHKKRHSRKKQRIPPARYVHPTTQQTPLHLACQLVDVDQNQVSAKELCRVMDGLLRTYPEALVWKDVDGHVPLHYAIAPNHIRANHMNAKITTTTDGTIIVSTTTQEESEDHQDDAEPPPPTATTPAAVKNHTATTDVDRDEEDWRARGIFVQHLFHSNLPAAHEYWQQSDVLYDEGAGRGRGGIGSKSSGSNGGCSPLYRVLQTLPDDFDRSGPTVDYIKVLLQASYSYSATTNENNNDNHNNTNTNTNTNNHNNMAGIGNASDGDKPLGLLYRRFTRQFDISEMFFPGDNSRSAVVRHREQYKYAAGNTWKIIEALLKPPSQYVTTNNPPATAGSQDTESNRSLGLVPSGSSAYSPSNQEAVWGLVHRAVQMETPPDLLRYIVETNAHDLTKVDGAGNLPLHYAAMVKPPNSTINKRHNYRSSSGALTVGITNVITNTTTASHFPSFYTKYVVDELLYKFPDAASMTNAEGKFPLALAVTSGKQWIGGGIKSLYDAYPKALQQIDLQQRHNQSLRQALSMGGEGETDEGTNHNNTKNEDNNNTKYDDEGNIVEGEEAGAAQQLTNDEKLLKQATMTSQYTTGSAAMTNDDDDDDDEDAEGIIKDEHHDAIMLVQQSDVDFREVAIAMWAHEEDAGVQMLGCCAIVRLLDDDNNRTMQTTPNDDDNNIQDSDNTDEKNAKTLRIALTATASVVNAMKAHPNEMIVQEKACRALQFLAPADGRREVSMVASGAVASVVAAMQAHVGDASVQEEACAAIGAIVKHGGGDRATVVASVSGVTAILNAIAAHPREVKVQQQGLNALWQLTNFDANDASMPELPRAQTEPLLAQAKEVFPNECNELVGKLSERMKE